MKSPLSVDKWAKQPQIHSLSTDVTLMIPDRIAPPWRRRLLGVFAGLSTVASRAIKWIKFS